MSNGVRILWVDDEIDLLHTMRSIWSDRILMI